MKVLMALTLIGLAQCASNPNDFRYGGTNFGDNSQYTFEQKMQLIEMRDRQMRQASEASQRVEDSAKKLEAMFKN